MDAGRAWGQTLPDLGAELAQLLRNPLARRVALDAQLEVTPRVLELLCPAGVSGGSASMQRA